MTHISLPTCKFIMEHLIIIDGNTAICRNPILESFGKQEKFILFTGKVGF